MEMMGIESEGAPIELAEETVFNSLFQPFVEPCVILRGTLLAAPLRHVIMPM